MCKSQLAVPIGTAGVQYSRNGLIQRSQQVFWMGVTCTGHFHLVDFSIFGSCCGVADLVEL